MAGDVKSLAIHGICYFRIINFARVVIKTTCYILLVAVQREVMRFYKFSYRSLLSVGIIKCDDKKSLVYL